MTTSHALRFSGSMLDQKHLANHDAESKRGNTKISQIGWLIADLILLVTRLCGD